MPVDRYAVFGHPISHSKSPRIHAAFARQTGQTIEYTAVDVPAESFREELFRFAANGGKGLSCTVPLKELAWQMADEKSERASRAKAVNTMTIGESGKILGDNTDGLGLLRDMTINLGIPIKCLDILLLGAGGASRGIIGPLLAEQPRIISIANRTIAKAEQLAMEFSALGSIEVFEFNALKGKSFDLIINATAASLSGELPPLPEDLLNPNGACYDLAYANQPTAFVHWGVRSGARISVDGIGMLVEQAAEAFFIWRGIRPQTRPLIEQLNSERSAATNM